ncbi:3D (Asp-Asp-Asp) domain-containing protein [Alteribacillus persepolensis]|uniref:3D (Asp-Asp-Asp) domain-containing protein n=1 Tax=Alteribacillus persepolensis TaxID=568899 RepID=A0A1G8C7U1_9BACI|nr:peptidoglycan-binding protein [Alteribacillus persepolensis]SDH41455.1 3D (Asp-Asp-Asp) domain-containing protein [Alteribacillus persepolensis]
MHQFLYTRWFTMFAIPALAAGFLFFAAPVNTDAQSLGDKELSVGQESSQVEDIEELLVQKGFLNKAEQNGIFDDTTENAVKNYQEEHGLLIDGIAGPHTIGALTIVKEGDEGPLVETLQQRLETLGFYHHNVDGRFGPNTHEAVVSFQSSKDILVDGLAGPQTYAALENALYNDTPAKETENNEEKDGQTTTSGNADVSTSSEPQAERADVGSETSNDEQGRTLQVEATAYTANCNGCSGVTATGVDLHANPDANVIAVDPDVIPLGSKVRVEGHGTYTAADTGGAINGNKIDIYMQNKSDASNFGRQNLEVTVLE